MAAASSPASSRSRAERGAGAAPWRPRGLRSQPVPHSRLPTPDALLRKYELGAQLGRGNFGTVWEARERSSGRRWAVKVMAKSDNKLKMLLLGREIQVLKMVEHPNIVYLREIFETPENVYLILELCERGELASFSMQRGKLSETDARVIIAGVIDAIQYLHRHGIVHRDLKLENVLLAASPMSDEDTDDATGDLPQAKLSDFGLAEVKDKRDHDHMMELFCGTPYCMAPEILSERAYSQQCDVWSMGVILYTLFAGGTPYLGGNERDVLYSIHRHPDLQDDVALSEVSASARDLLNRMLHLDPAYRITAAEVVSHPWMTGQCTQASASQDILTLMKEWRMEMSSDDLTENASQDSEPASNASHSQETQQDTTELTSASGGRFRRLPSAPARSVRSVHRSGGRSDLPPAAVPRPNTSDPARPRPAGAGRKVSEPAAQRVPGVPRPASGGRGRARSRAAAPAAPHSAQLPPQRRASQPEGTSARGRFSPRGQMAAPAGAPGGRAAVRSAGSATVAPPAAARERCRPVTGPDAG